MRQEELKADHCVAHVSKIFIRSFLCKCLIYILSSWISARFLHVWEEKSKKERKREKQTVTRLLQQKRRRSAAKPTINMNTIANSSSPLPPSSCLCSVIWCLPNLYFRSSSLFFPLGICHKLQFQSALLERHVNTSVLPFPLVCSLCILTFFSTSHLL